MKDECSVDSDGFVGAPQCGGQAEIHGQTDAKAQADTNAQADVKAQRGKPSATRVRGRATLPAVAGSDPHPGEPPLTPRDASENDARLTADKPPHWA